ncbi:hypothetical protein BGZ83_005163 [Gryganskiella cystojenkinii]|nr:hypothetical protein BGZ83_005163 [Gryganskiella cystojenkinii]
MGNVSSKLLSIQSPPSTPSSSSSSSSTFSPTQQSRPGFLLHRSQQQLHHDNSSNSNSNGKDLRDIEQLLQQDPAFFFLPSSYDLDNNASSEYNHTLKRSSQDEATPVQEEIDMAATKTSSSPSSPSSKAQPTLSPAESLRNKPLPSFPPPSPSSKEKQQRVGAEANNSATNMGHGRNGSNMPEVTVLQRPLSPLPQSHGSVSRNNPTTTTTGGLTRSDSLSRQSMLSQSSLSNKSTSSTNSSNGGSSNSSANTSTSTGLNNNKHSDSNGSNNNNSDINKSPTNSSTRTFARAVSVHSGKSESLSQLSLQRFPTGENGHRSSFENNHHLSSSSSLSSAQGLDPQQQHYHQYQLAPHPLRTTSVVSTASSSSSARSSSGSSGFKFSKPNLSFKIYGHGSNNNSNKNNDSKPSFFYQQHQDSSSTGTAGIGSPNGRHSYPLQQQPHLSPRQQPNDPFANSPFPSILMSIRLPQSLLNKYVLDQESFRHGKGIWGIGKYSWTVTVLSRANGKKYVIKRVSKSQLPPSAYYHYPTTAHQLCTCPACKSARDLLINTGQLNAAQLDEMREVLVIQNRGKKELPQLPPTSPHLSSQRPLSATFSSPGITKDSKDEKEKQRKSFNLYHCNNVSTPNHNTHKLFPFTSANSSPNSTPQDTPVSSRSTTPLPSPLRQQASPSTAPAPIPGPNNGRIRSQSHCHNANTNTPTPNTNATSEEMTTPTAQSPKSTSTVQPFPSPLLPSATPLSWPHHKNGQDQEQGLGLSRAKQQINGGGICVSEQQEHDDALQSPLSSGLNNYVASSARDTELSSGARMQPKPTLKSTGGKETTQSRQCSSRRPPFLQRHASTPNMSRPITGLDVLEDDPSRLEKIRQQQPSKVDSTGSSNNTPPVDSALTQPSLGKALPAAPGESTANVKGNTNNKNGDTALWLKMSLDRNEDTDRHISPFETNNGEFKQMDPESPTHSRYSKGTQQGSAVSAPLTFSPPPHALPMELVLLQTYNDSDHLPEHHEWTQDQDYWYYVTKAHGVKRRKLKKVSSWWLDMGSLGAALLSGNNSSSEPIATSPIYNMGHSTGHSTPQPASPLSSEIALGRLSPKPLSRHMAKESVSSITSQDSSNASVSFPSSTTGVTLRRQNSPRSSYMGKYYYVNWEEYTSL